MSVTLFAIAISEIVRVEGPSVSTLLHVYDISTIPRVLTPLNTGYSLL
jgi:hypothetical protein